MTTMAFRSAEPAIRGIRPPAAKASAACAACRSLVSISRWPSGTSHPPQQVESVRAAVQRHQRLVRPGFRGQKPDLPGRHVGDVGDQNTDPAPQPGGQRLVQVTLVDMPVKACETGCVSPGAAHGGRVDVHRVHLGLVHGRDQRGAYRARATAQVDDDIAGTGESGGLPDEELGAATRDEDPGLHGDPQAAELRPAEDVLQGQASGSPVNHGVKFVRGSCRGDEQPGFVLGEDTAGRPEPSDDERV